MSLHQCFQIVIYTHNNLYFVYVAPPLFLCNTLDFSLAKFLLFTMNFNLLVRNKTKKYHPISHRIINYQTFLACIIVYQLIQSQCPHSNNPLEKGLRKRASVQNESTSKLKNRAGMKYLVLHAESFILVPPC